MQGDYELDLLTWSREMQNSHHPSELNFHQSLEEDFMFFFWLYEKREEILNFFLEMP